MKELSSDETTPPKLNALIDQIPNQIAINSEGTTDLVINEKTIAIKGGKTETQPGIIFFLISYAFSDSWLRTKDNDPALGTITLLKEIVFSVCSSGKNIF